MRIASVVPARTLTSAGATMGAAPGAGAAGGSAAAVAGCIAGVPGATAGVLAGTLAAGVTVVVMACAVCPGAGGWTVVVVTLPFLSVVTTCWGCPVATACFFACSIAASCFDWHPVNKLRASAMVTAGTSLWGVFIVWASFFTGLWQLRRRKNRSKPPESN